MESQSISNEESESSKVAISVLVLMFLAGFTLWLLQSPVEKGSVLFWVGAFLMAIPGYAAAESFGTLSLGVNFVKKLPKAMRIVFGVLWVLVCLLIIGLVVGVLSSFVEV